MRKIVALQCIANLLMTFSSLLYCVSASTASVGANHIDHMLLVDTSDFLLYSAVFFRSAAFNNIFFPTFMLSNLACTINMLVRRVFHVAYWIIVNSTVLSL